MADARTAIMITLDPAHEGGYQKMTNDRANWSGGQVGLGILVGTKYGITALDMPGADIANLTVPVAIAYYEQNYWKNFYSQIELQEAANKLFDLGVLFGVGTAVKVLQQSLGCPADGEFGPATLSLLNSDCGKDPGGTLQKYKDAMHAHAQKVAANNPNDVADLPDWNRRIDS